MHIIFPASSRLNTLLLIDTDTRKEITSEVPHENRSNLHGQFFKQLLSPHYL